MAEPLIYLGIFFIALGFIVWHFKLAGLLTAYDPKKIRDKAGFAKWGGTNIILLGLLLLIIYFLIGYMPGLEAWLGKLILLASIGVLFRMYRGFEKFEKR